MTQKLSARVEALEGPDRSIDAQIYFAITNGVGCGMTQDAPRYTASLDAAMALVPEGYGWRLWVPNSTALASISVTMWGNGRSYAPHETTAATPALALCAAALKARGL